MRNYKFKVKKNRLGIVLNMRVMFKKCSKCGEVLFKSEFYNDKRSPIGLSSQCKECNNSKYTHTCEQCGKGFKSGQIKSRFCSRDCKARWQKDNLAGKNNPNWKGGEIVFNCDFCGKECVERVASYNNTKTHFCSIECMGKWKSQNGRVKCNCSHCGREIEVLKSKYDKCKNHFCDSKCQYEYQSGKNSPTYNPNITDEERELGRNIEGYKDWRKEVYERDNYICQCCGDNKGHNLNAHHIYGYTEHKDLRTDVDNGTTLCEECHKRYHKQYGYTNNNYKDFRTFLYNEMMKQNTLEARLFYINTMENIALRLEIRGLLGLESA